MPTLRTIITQLADSRVLVVGDAILDQYIWAVADRVSPEAPALVFHASHRESKLGGAAGVARLLRNLEVPTAFVGVVGDDDQGRTVRNLLDADNIDHSLTAVDRLRPTTLKERLMGQSPHRHPHQVIRIDWESRVALGQDLEQCLIGRMSESIERFQCISISDYGKGLCTPALLRHLIDNAANKQIPTIVDPARNGDMSRYGGVNTLKLNRLQAQNALQCEITSEPTAIKAAQSLRSLIHCESVVITLDKDGIAFVTNRSQGLIPTEPVDIYDITGAGDTVQAILAAGLAAGHDIESLIPIANAAARLQVGAVGVANLSIFEIDRLLENTRPSLAHKIVDIASLREICAAQQRRGKRVVFTNGCFDLLHAGHTQYLEEAARCGDTLIVAINSDSSVRRLKGSHRPLIAENHRASLLSSLQCVDYVIVFDEATPHRLLGALKPDVLVKGGDYETSEVIGAEVVEAYGGKVRTMALIEGLSTTSIATKLREAPCPQ